MHAKGIAEAVRHVMAPVQHSSSAPASADHSTPVGAGTMADGSPPATDQAASELQPPEIPEVDKVVVRRTLAHTDRRAPITPEAMQGSLGKEYVGFVFEAGGKANQFRYRPLNAGGVEDKKQSKGGRGQNR